MMKFQCRAILAHEQAARRRRPSARLASRSSFGVDNPHLHHHILSCTSLQAVGGKGRGKVVRARAERESTEDVREREKSGL